MVIPATPARAHIAPFATWRYRLPFPPSMNHYWQQAYKTRHTYVSEAGKAFQKAVQTSVRHRPRSRRRLHLTIELQRGDHVEYDIDNFVKPVQDALALAGVYVNDKQVDKLVVDRLPVQAPGCCLVTVREIGYATPIIKIGRRKR